jgi:hypothetical protein
MAMHRTHMVGVGVGEMAGAIILASTPAMRGKDTTAAAVIIRSSTTAAAAAGKRAAAVEAMAAGAMAGVVAAIDEIFLIARKNERRRIAIRSGAAFLSS